MVMAALAALALIYRVALVRTALATVDSDQAVLGIMARHILRGDHPLFFYGQGYQGALEAYLTAGVFGLFGQSDLALRVVSVLVSVALVLQLYALALRLYGRRVALATGLWLAVPAPVFVYWTTAAGAGYVEVMALGAAIFMIAIRRWGLDKPKRHDWPALGLLTGLGVWAHPVIAYYLVALALAYAPYAWRRARGRGARRLNLRSRRAWAALALFALGAGPWLGYTLVHGGATVAVLAGHPTLAALPDTLRRLCGETLPLLVGGALPSTIADEFVGYANTHTLVYALAVVAFLYLALRLVVSPGGLPAQFRALRAGRPLADAPLALLPLVTIALYLTSRFETLAWTTHNPRYLLPLYTATPYLLACAVPAPTRALALRRARRWTAVWTALARRVPSLAPWQQEMLGLYQEGATELAGRSHRLIHEFVGLYREGARALARPAPALALGAALAVNIYGSVQYQAPPRVTPLAASLLSRGDGAVYCLYWLAWRLDFESGERLTPVVTRGLAVDPRPNGNRYPPYLAAAARARRWAYILPYDVDAPALAALLRREGVPYARWRWGNASVFDGPARPSFPPTLALAPSQPPTARVAAR